MTSFCIKCIIVCFWLFALGLPLVQEWKALFLLLGIIVLMHSTLVLSRRKWVTLSILVFALACLRFIWPGLNIQTGENVFLYTESGEIFEKELPAPIFEDWKCEFNKLYKDKGSQWVNSTMPSRLYAYNPDSFWTFEKYSRKIDHIDFRGINQFRGGFANDQKYNYWHGEMHRRLMPFWVMYEFDVSAVNSVLFWKGPVHRIDVNGQHEKIVHQNTDPYLIDSNDIGSRFYFMFLPEIWSEFNTCAKRFILKDPALYESLKMTTAFPEIILDKPWYQDLRSALIALVTLAIFIYSISKCLRVRWPETAKIIIICAAALCVTHAVIYVDWGKNLGQLYPPHGGGDDGMVHDYQGVEIVQNLDNGNIAEALKGSEPVYWFTPGMRYFRAVEKLFFGATNLGYLLFIILYPVIIFKLFGLFVREKWAWIVTLLFIALPPNMNFSLSQYIVLARLGYPAPLATAFYIAAFVLWFKTPIAEINNNKWFVFFVGGVFLFFSVFNRPNNAIPVMLMGSAMVSYLFYCRQWKIAAACIVGMGTGLWMPFHNLYFGNEFHLITSSPSIALPYGPSDYWQALLDWISNAPQSDALIMVKERCYQIFTLSTQAYPEWMDMWTFVGLISRVIALVMCIVVALFPKKIETRLRLLACCALSCFPFMLIVFFPQPRYISIGWDLCIAVSLIVIIRYAVSQYALQSSGDSGRHFYSFA